MHYKTSLFDELKAEVDTFHVVDLMLLAMAPSHPLRHERLGMRILIFLSEMKAQ